MKYRREIDGLRAVAVLPVILFHAGFSVFSGGFIGVDVFFVISGYLITTIILADKEKGVFSLVTFYERRARRILPALFFVMVCCLPFAWAWLPPNHLEAFCQSLTSVSLFTSNILFWKESGYFATTSELKPLLHTWSLAVEEQYYVLFPLFLMALWKLRKRLIFGSLMFIAVASFAVAQYGAYNFASATFFLLPSRLWELAIGALIAFYFLYKKDQGDLIRSNKLVSEVFGCIGFALILYSIFSFDKATPFPSAFALIPTIGTALIIIFTTQETLVGRFLGTKIMVGFGLISYSTYLWHQPLFVFARHRSSAELSVQILLALSALSIILAYFSWRLVEVPFRNKAFFGRKKIFTFAFVSSVFFVAVGLTGNFKDGFPERFGFPDNLVVSFERSSPKCPDDLDMDDFSCGLGDPKKEPSFFVLGDSHAGSLYDAFDSAANSVGGSGRFASLSGCPPLLGDFYLLRRDLNSRACNEVNKKVRNSIVEEGISNLFLVARWNSYTDIGNKKNLYPYLGRTEKDKPNVELSRKVFIDSFNRTIEEYEKLGVKLFIITTIPAQDYTPDSLYKYAFSKRIDSERIEILNKHSLKYSKHKLMNRNVSSIFSSTNYPSIINTDEFFCNNQSCLVGSIETSYYHDPDHLSLAGAKLLKPKLEELLTEIYSSKNEISTASN